MTIASMFVTIRYHKMLSQARQKPWRDSTLCDLVAIVRCVGNLGYITWTELGKVLNIKGIYGPIGIGQELVG